MMELAEWLARRIWGAMLWTMRRPWMRRLQAASLRLLPPAWRPAALRSKHRQDAFARRYGLRTLKWALFFLLVSWLVSLAYVLTVKLVTSGVLEAL